MKKIKIEKKLSLNKELIANLNNKQLAELKGGDSTITRTCPTYGCPTSTSCPNACGGGDPGLSVLC